jgi:hypothetical protein
MGRGTGSLLRDDVAEDAAFFLLEVVASGAEFIEHTAWHKGRGSELRIRVIEFLPGVGPMVLEDAHVFEALIALEILDALGGEGKKLFQF